MSELPQAPLPYQVLTFQARNSSSRVRKLKALIRAEGQYLWKAWPVTSQSGICTSVRMSSSSHSINIYRERLV